MGVVGVLIEFDLEFMKKFIGSLLVGLEEGNEYLESNKKVGVFDFMKVLKDLDINCVIGFGFYFLKGMGKGLKGE